MRSRNYLMREGPAPLRASYSAGRRGKMSVMKHPESAAGVPTVADRLALVIAVETYQDSAVAPAPHAEADGAAFARALEALGFARDKQVVLLGSQATKTAVESRLRRLAKEPPEAEALYVYCAGHGFAEGGKGFLACY